MNFIVALRSKVIELAQALDHGGNDISSVDHPLTIVLILFLLLSYFSCSVFCGRKSSYGSTSADLSADAVFSSSASSIAVVSAKPKTESLSKYSPAKQSSSTITTNSWSAQTNESTQSAFEREKKQEREGKQRRERKKGRKERKWRKEEEKKRRKRREGRRSDIFLLRFFFLN